MGGRGQSVDPATKKTHFLFSSSVLIKNLIEINQAIKSGRCNGGECGGREVGGREKGERMSTQTEKDPLLIQILTTTPNGTECVCGGGGGGARGFYNQKDCRSSSLTSRPHSSKRLRPLNMFSFPLHLDES